MTTFKISADVIERFSVALKYFEPTTDVETRRQLEFIRLENKAGQCYAIVTNHKVAAIEHLGPTTEPDSAAHLTVSEELLKMCQSGGTITVTSIPEVLLSMCQNDKGQMVANCCALTSDGLLQNWRKWAAPDAITSNGVMHWNLFHVQTLLQTSPSGKIYFPELIDATKPVTVRDYLSEKWVGLFFPKPVEGDPVMKSATLPEWWNK